MIEVKRTLAEVLAIASLEPSLKMVFVEGLADAIFISDFYSSIHKSDTTVYHIDLVDFSDVIDKGEPTIADRLKRSNKNKVVYLGQELEQIDNGSALSCVCVVDMDWDRVLAEEIRGKYLAYTDYNSMELYLFDETTVTNFFRHVFHVTGEINSKQLLESLSVVAREIFHCHLIAHLCEKRLVAFDKDLRFDKSSWKASLDLNKYWGKVMNSCGLVKVSDEQKSLFDERMAHDCNPKAEIRGHDFVHCLFLCIKTMKSRVAMDEEEFANAFWSYADFSRIGQEPLFQRLSNL